MKHLRWMIVGLELLLVGFALIVPQVDAPETAYNETDTPTNLTTPFVANFAMSHGHRVTIPTERRVWSEPRDTVYTITVKAIKRASHSTLILLCELLC